VFPRRYVKNNLKTITGRLQTRVRIDGLYGLGIRTEDSPTSEERRERPAKGSSPAGEERREPPAKGSSPTSEERREPPANGSSPASEERRERPVKGSSPASEVRIRPWDSPVQRTATADREYTAGKGITKNNPGAGLQDRGDNVLKIV
jgi:hypothetical protein